MAVRTTGVKEAFRACRGAFLVLVAFSFGTNVLTLVSPLYMMQVYDRVLSSRSGDTLVMLTLVAVFALGVLALLDAVRSLMLAQIGEWLDDRLGPEVFAGALKLAHRADSRVAAQGLRDLAVLRGFLSGPAVLPLLDAPWAPIFVAALFVLHPVLGLIGLGAAVALFALAVINEAATKHPLVEANAAAGRTHQRADAALRNAEVIRAMGMGRGVVRIWRREGAAARAAQRSARTRGVAVLGVSKFVRLLVQTLILGAAAWLVIQHETSAGAMFASIFLLGRALAPVENAISTWKSLVSARISRRRLDELLAAAPPDAVGMELPAPEGELDVDRVTFIPPGADEPSLRGVGFRLMPGEALGVVGPSAAGKSTLARVIVGTWRPVAGKVRLDGADISVWHDSGGSRHIGYLPQDIELFAGSVRENIARLDDASPAEVIEAARLVGLHEMIMRLPRGYDTEIGDAGLKLSGGMRQRIGLARAVFGRPRLVVLDEPNASLDHEGEEALHRTIVALKASGATIVMVAHRPSVLGLADKLLVMKEGAVHAFGSRADVMALLNPGAGVRRATIPARGLAQVPVPQNA